MSLIVIENLEKLQILTNELRIRDFKFMSEIVFQNKNDLFLRFFITPDCIFFDTKVNAI